jgi:hypothetical protein
MISLRNRTVKNFFEIVWQYVSVILSDYFSMRTNGHYNRSFAGIWLLVCNLLLAAYAGNLWERLVRPQQIDKIDSWDDLYTKPQWNKLKIRTLEYLDMADFAMTDKSEMAQNFKKRIILIDPFKFIFDDSMVETAINGIFSGKEVFVVDSLAAHYYKSSNKFKYIVNQFNEGFDYHISETGAGSKPYFIIITKRLNKTLTKKLNDV